MELQQQSSESETSNSPNVEIAESSDPTSNDGVFQIQVRIVDLLSDYTVSGVLLGFTPGEVAILVEEPLSEKRDVTVHLDSFSFEGHTLFCGPHENEYRVHISIDDLQGGGLRRTPRFPVMIPAELLTSSCDYVSITIRDLSRDGMGIESPIPLKAGQPIAIVSGPAFVFAVVRHCQHMPDGLFRAGVEMHHLFEMPGKPAEEPTGSGILRKVWGRRFSQKPQC